MKIVRDRIPEIVKQNKKVLFENVDNAKAVELLCEKVKEELREFKREYSKEEFCDLLEVVYSIGEKLNFDSDEIHDLAEAKREMNGGFTKNVVMVKNER